jgi:RNA polymerase sigma factor (sigma-70 family)
MATDDMNDFLRRLTQSMVAESLSDQSDQQLVERFLSERDPAVFEAIVRRHGLMVYRVCARLLRQDQDAEDAFQATFLVLGQNLRSVRKRVSLASWLHGVARRVALKARARAACIDRREPRASPCPTSSLDDLTWRELRSVLDDELLRLPEKWRLPLILCYFEGRTQHEAARQLGWGKNTLRRRLEEAREALGRRLARRGFGPSLLPAALFVDGISPTPPAGLLAATAETAAHAATSPAGAAVAVAAEVLSLARGVAPTMFLTSIKSVAAALLVVASVCTATVAGALGARMTAEEPRPVARDDDKTEGETRPQGEERERPRKLARVPDPSPELQRELLAFDAYRHGSEEKFAELERKADELLKKYPARDDQARIYYEVAHVAAQSDIRKHTKRVQAYARKSLALSRDPLQRGFLFSYLGSAAEVEDEKPFADRRRRAAEALLTGYAELLAQELPEKAPELPVVEKLAEGIDQDPVQAGRDRARHAKQVAARREAEFIRDLVQRRDTLATQLRWLYHPHPKIHGRNPEGPEELRALAGKILHDRAAVDALLDKVTAP